MPDGKEDVLMVRVGGAGAATTSERATDLVWAGFPASVMVTVKFAVPLAVGVPEIWPEAAPRASPAGRLPPVMDQVYGVVPPLTLTELEYDVPLVPDGSDDVLIVKAGGAGAATASERATDLLWAGLPASVTETVKLAVPVAVGVPEIRPEDGSRASPAGRLPPVMDQVYGVVPPVACRRLE